MTHSQVSIEHVQATVDNKGSDGATATDEIATGRASRREFLGLGPAALAAAAMVGGGGVLSGSPLMAASEDGSDRMKAGWTAVSKDSATIVGEPITYLATPNPEISSSIITIPPGTTTEWMTHPVQGYLYVLEGTLTVEYADGPRKEFKAGQGFPQARSKWHRGRNDGETPVRFLGVFFGGKDVPNVLHPPQIR
jgi:quercetin dioxygenase-like cupin family protein